MSAEPDDTSDVRAELNRLAANLKATLAAARRSPELRRLQQDLEQGLEEVQARLKDALQEVAASPAVRRARQEAEEIAARVRAGELEEGMRRELAQALERLNHALEQARRSWEAQEQGEDRPPE